MSDLTDRSVTRRSLLRLAGVTVAMVGVRYVTAAPASAFTSTRATEDAFRTSGRIASRRSTLLEVPQQLGVSLSNVDIAGSGGAIEFEFSPRLYRHFARPWVQVDGASADLLMSVSEVDASTGTQVASVILPEKLTRAGSVTVVVGALHPVAYPRDLVVVDAPARKTAMGPRRGGARRRLAREGAARSHAPWGGIVRGGFDRVEWDGGRFAYYPSGFAVSAIGSGPLPAGSTVEVEADARIVTDLEPVGAWYEADGAIVPEAEHSLAGDVLVVRFLIPHALEPNATYRVLLRAETAQPSGNLEGFVTPRATLDADVEARLSQRDTRQTCSTREGSAPTLEQVQQLAAR